MRRAAPIAIAVIAALVAGQPGCGTDHHHDRNLAFNHGLRATPNPPTTIDKLTLSFDIVNDSDEDAWNVEWLIKRDGVAFISGAIAHIENWDYEFGSVAFTETAGDHVYEFIIDPNGHFDEWDEDDNVSVLKVTVPPGGTG